MSDRCRLYLITPPTFDLDAFKLAFTEALAAGTLRRCSCGG
ncbi:MAG: hypothetical protein R3C16_11380 [Hyphomonadaceae bacterium]